MRYPIMCFTLNKKNSIQSIFMSAQSKMALIIIKQRNFPKTFVSLKLDRCVCGISVCQKVFPAKTKSVDSDGIKL